MQIKLFTIPIAQVEEQNEELNKFLRTHRVLEVEKELVQTPSGAYWCFSVSYTEGQAQQKQRNTKEKRTDYKTVLSKEEFEVFTRLREVRKQIAIEENVSTYIVFTDAELAEIARMEAPTPNAIRKIKGIGDVKAEKYGERLLATLSSP